MMYNRFALSFVFLGVICAIFAQETTIASSTSEKVSEASPQNDQAQEAATTMIPTRIPSPQTVPSINVDSTLPPVTHNAVTNYTILPQATKNEKPHTKNSAGIFTSSAMLLLTLFLSKTVL